MLSKTCHVFLLFAVGIAFQCCESNAMPVDPNDEKTSKQRNVLLICVDDLRPELASFGATHIHSPNIDRLASQGRAFHSHYVNAPSCGCSRYTLLTGRYGESSNNALFKRAKQVAKDAAAVPPSMPEWFRNHGYCTVSVGKVSHHPGGLGGKLWDDPDDLEMPNAWDQHLMPSGAWKNPLGVMHGLAHGNVRGKSQAEAGRHDVFESAEGPDSNYPDGLIATEGLKQIETLAALDKPFFLAVGLIKPHLPFGAPQRYLDLYKDVTFPPIAHPNKPAGKTTWHKSGEFTKYNSWGKDPRTDDEFATEARRHYAACVSYVDKHVGDLLAKLTEVGADENTVVVLWGDHGWHLGEHGIWGKHCLFEEALLAPLIVDYPGIQQRGAKTDALVSTLDIFPTLCEIAGIEKPSFVEGRSLQPLLTDPSAEGHDVLSYWGGANTIRTKTHRMTVHKNGYVELYDHTSEAKETANVADQHPDLVDQLKLKLANFR